MSTLTQNVYKVHYNTFHTCCMDLSSPLLLLCFLVAHLLALACLRPLASQDFTYSCGSQADSGGPVVDMNSSDYVWSIVNVERNGLHSTMFILLNPLSHTAILTGSVAMVPTRQCSERQCMCMYIIYMHCLLLVVTLLHNTVYVIM